MAMIICQNCKRQVSTARTTCPYCGAKIPKADALALLILLGFVFAVLLAPIIVVLGMFGKFLLKGLYKNVLQIEEFKKFRKTYTIISFSWFVFAIAFCVLGFTVLPEEFAMIGWQTLCIGNIAIFALSIVFGNKIYKKHKDDLPQDTVAQAVSEGNGEVAVVTQEQEVVNESPVDKEEPIEEVSTNEVGQISDESMFKNLSAIKQLKELLDMGAITQKEFDDKKKILLSGVGATTKAVVSTKEIPTTVKEERKGLKKALNIVGLFLTIITIAAFVVGVVFLFTRDFRYYAGHIGSYETNNYQEVWKRLPFHVAAFSKNEMGANFVPCLFTFIGAVLMAISLTIKFIVEVKPNKSNNKVILMDLITLLVSVIPIVFSAILVDWAKSGVKLFLILVASSAIAVFVHLILSIVEKVISSSYQKPCTNSK